MDPNQALAILQQACPQISTTLAQHQLIQQALGTLREALIGDPTPRADPVLEPDLVESNSRQPQ